VLHTSSVLCNMYTVIYTHIMYDAGMDTVDFSFYPDRDYQLAWLRTFLELSFAESSRPASDISDVDVERLYVQVNKFSLVRATHSLLSVCFCAIDIVEAL